MGVESSSDFRCFLCAKEGCELSGRLAGAEVDIAGCSDGRCNGQMRLKKAGKGGGLLVGCSVPTCKSIWWLPKFVRSAVPGDLCGRCSAQQPVRKLNVSIIMSKAPPFLDPECTMCPVCDSLWSRLDLPSLAVRKVPAAGAARPNAGGGGGGGHLQQQTLPFGNNRNAAPPPVGHHQGGFPNQPHPAPQAPYHPPPPPQQQQQQQWAPRPQAVAPVNINISETPVCACNEPAVQRTTTKEGPNMGRTFFTCGNRDKRCNFFQWCDAVVAPTAAPTAGHVVRTASGHQSATAAGGRGGGGAGVTGGGVIVCKCNEPAPLFTVNKEGPNRGRKFYSCSKQ